MRFFWLLILLICPGLSAAETFQVVPGQVLHLRLPASGWHAGDEPPEFLVEERLATLSDGMLAMMKKSGMTDRRMAVIKMLGNNELFVYKTATGAHMEVDFSALQPGDAKPTAEHIRGSAEYAGQSLQSEENYQDARYRVTAVTIPGLNDAHRLEAAYKRYGQPGKFVGIIGFSDPYWVFFYYTDPLSNPDDLSELNAILQSLRIEQP